MPSVDHRDVGRAVAESLRVLGPLASRDRRVRAGPLEWNCLRTAAHIAHDPLACAGQVTDRPDDAHLPFGLVVPPDASPRDLLRAAADDPAVRRLACRTAGPRG
ncbi:hypothetical protein GQS52_14850 [Streptomyces sp. SCUT-3]|uniref:hypothetical protein n=1 Tax=Streptomyces sp. SCUT-3 TaxID=2684469 RepID=UPI000CC566E9|nr:hypothetical protein [Streptomyces sp. SCUT-3]PLW72186.1 hypothetical protein C0036_13945 [Streptomyces sp. DJ]QMV22841.1 hypothetical protein GQS52_14850 [Streptomyces sp. SCUT-3]